MDKNQLLSKCNDIKSNVSKVIIGKDNEIELVLATFLSGGHILLEDLPGLGKTMMVRSFSKTLNLPFKRIQFTPDLLPSDITGISYFNQRENDFIFREGPLFSNIVLADEINRATPRTQSSLLEAMEEKQITSDGVTRSLNQPFMVLATQNPLETFGTFPLPEAQLDRFAIRMSMGYPEFDEELSIMINNESKPIDNINSVIDGNELSEMLNEVKNVSITNEVATYLLSIITKTRNSDKIQIGASPRASVALLKISKAFALIKGRDYVIPEDIKYLAPYVLNHRIVSRDARDVLSSINLIKEVLSEVNVPVENIR